MRKRMVSKPCPMLILLASMAQSWSGIGTAQSFPVLSGEDQVIQYQAPPKDDPVARLQARIDQGQVHLDHVPGWGYLPSLLKQLHIPLSSQMLVFSKTSFQQHRISPQTPRALYFNDDVYVGWVQGGEVLEVSAVDPERGAIFYSLDQRRDVVPKFVRREECLQCHASPKTQGVPGHLVRSVYPNREGLPQLQAGSFLTDHSSPFRERWGGWYVTGKHGAQRHMGNVWVLDNEHPEELDREAGANIINLRTRIDVSNYLGADSDLVALMVFEHQTRLHNLLTRTNWETRLALNQQEAMNRALNRPQDHWFDSTRSRIENQVDHLLRYFLFVDEVKLTEPVSGTSGFEHDFPRIGPQDHRGRSLRDLDLKTRLFRYPCSFLIYSQAFDALPAAAKDVFYQRLWKVLTNQDPSQDFSSLAVTDRQAILEILAETKSDLPEYWKR
ncbi:MAG: hypothetical protein AB1898_22930 [Acidobacteriota bacterium]